MSRRDLARTRIGGVDLTIIGTAHVSRESVNLVRETIEGEKPDIVAIELDPERYRALRHRNKWRETDLWRIVREGKTGLFLASIILSAYQKRIGSRLGVEPGEEMLAAARSARRIGARIELVDRPVGETLSRAWKSASIREKLLVLAGLLEMLFFGGDMGEEDVERLKDADVLSMLLEEFGRMSPGIKRALVDERDEHIAARVYNLARELGEGRIVLVVGAGHARGIAERLKKWAKRGIEHMPVQNYPLKKKERKRAGPSILVPLLVFGLFAWAVYTGGLDRLFSMLSAWVFYNAVFAAIGALLAGGHPLTIITAALSAPLTSLNPSLAAGWFAGIVELFVRRPRVRDFEDLARINSVLDLWKNRVSRVLLVVVLTNLGSTLGTLVALWVMAGG